MRKIKILAIILALTLSSIPLTYAAGADDTYADASSQASLQENQVDYDSEEYQENVSNSLEEYQVIKEARKQGNVKNYDVYLDDDGILNVMVSDDTSDAEYGAALPSDCTQSAVKYEQALSAEVKMSDSNIDESADVIYRKVQFSKSYLRNIQKALRGHMKEFTLVSVGSGNMDNKVEIELTDSSKENDVLEFLEENTEDFNSEAVVFTMTDEPVEDAKGSFPG